MVYKEEEAEIVADAVVRALVAKIKAMEILDKGLVSDTGVSTVDRVAVILGSLNPRYYNKLLSTEPRKDDVDKVFEVARDTGMWGEEVVLLAMVRRMVVESLRSGVARVSDLVDTSDKEDADRKRAIEIS
ncbi:MAG: hypothetical protein QXH21_08190 [Ignisphaera sp.]